MTPLAAIDLPTAMRSHDLDDLVVVAARHLVLSHYCWPWTIATVQRIGANRDPDPTNVKLQVAGKGLAYRSIARRATTRNIRDHSCDHPHPSKHNANML